MSEARLMTVADMIVALQQLPPDAIVIVRDRSAWSDALPPVLGRAVLFEENPTYRRYEFFEGNAGDNGTLAVLIP